MEERYIGRNKLLDDLSACENLEMWDPLTCDFDTVKQVLLIVENIVKSQRPFMLKTLKTKQLDEMRAALVSYRDRLLCQHQHDEEKYLCENSLRHDLRAGFYRGRFSVEEEVLDWLERMVRDA